VDDKVTHAMSAWVAAVQPHCDEPVIAALNFQQAGMMSAGVKGGLGGMFFGRAAYKKSAERAGGFPSNVLLAVDKTKLYVFAYDIRSLDFDPPIAAWNRSEVNVETREQRAASKVIIDAPSTAAHHELETTSMTGIFKRMYREFVRLLEDPSAV
jgi:hypothetical protein